MTLVPELTRMLTHTAHLHTVAETVTPGVTGGSGGVGGVRVVYRCRDKGDTRRSRW